MNTNTNTHTLAHYTFTTLTLSQIMTLAHKMARKDNSAQPYRVRLANALKQAHKAVLVVNTKTGQRKLKTKTAARAIYVAVAKKQRAAQTRTKTQKTEEVHPWDEVTAEDFARLDNLIAGTEAQIKESWDGMRTFELEKELRELFERKELLRKLACKQLANTIAL